MSDIVERLRGCRSFQSMHDEAAAEIERLRAEIGEYANNEAEDA